MAHLAEALQAMRELMRLGYAPFTPQLTFFLEPFMQADHDTWLSIDLPWVAVADAVIRLPGESRGADVEVEQAHLFNVPVFYSIPALLHGLPPKIEAATL